MGRDDRVISDNGKEARFPFLDVNLIRYLGQNVDSSLLVDWTAFRGLGDKQLLRLIAKDCFEI
jgi:asparagine synthetase B (glutamine-hydrolysing)